MSKIKEMEGYNHDFKKVTDHGYKLIYKLNGEDKKEMDLAFVRTPFTKDNFFECLLQLLRSKHYLKSLDKSIKDVVTLK